MNHGFANQPNQFPTVTINNELANGGASATWQALYANTVAGTAIPVPYFTNPYEATKLAAATTTYNMSVQRAPGLDGHGVLVPCAARASRVQ